METNALINVRSVQSYEGNRPEVIELTSEGRIWEQDGTICFSYRESALTGLDGTVTTFCVDADTVALERKGGVISRMEFREGQTHKSLYDSSGLGSLLITVTTTQIENRLSVQGGTLRVAYSIEIEDAGLGTVCYEITVTRQ